MTVRIAKKGRALMAVVIAAVVCMLTATAFAADGDGPAELESIRQTLNVIEGELRQPGLSAKAVTELGRTIAPVRDEARAKVSGLEPRVADAQSRLKQLGPPPAKDAPPEAEAIAAERKLLTQRFDALDGNLRQARLLAVRADQLAAQIAERHSRAYTQELFAHSWSVLDVSFWQDAAGALGEDARQVSAVVRAWARHVHNDAGYGVVAAAIATMVGIVALLVFAVLRWRRRYPELPAPVTRLAKARACVWVFICAAVTAPLLTLIAAEVLDAYELLTPDAAELTIGVVVAVTVAAFGRAVALGVLAPELPARRLFACDDATARALASHFVMAARFLALTVFVKVVHHIVSAPQVLLVATSMLFVLAIMLLLLHLLLRLRATDDGPDGGPAANLWVRGIVWAYVIVAGAALLSGQVRFADFLTERLLASTAIFGVLYLLLVAVDLLFVEFFTTDSARGRTIAANIGLPPRRIGLVGALLSALLRVLLIILAIVLVIAPLEVTPTDLLDVVRGLTFSIRIGEVTISLSAILHALVTFTVTLVVVRIVQRWLQGRLLPRTDIEASLQLSIATIFGYAGFIVAVSLTMAALGLDLQKIAFVAGALSVGIGFGLQSIVSNFVSGLILLTERPIRVGDWIVAKGEEGYVRRIRVRATEIETFERASVIIPNSDLISGVVKNWTHGNTIGRIGVKVGVGYESDPEAVRDILLAVAAEHPGVLKTPAPMAFFLAFGDTGLSFELRCVVRDVQQSAIVRSELNFAILSRFRAAGVDYRLPSPPVPPVK
jgi:small-conductance mechanosensitive channel